MSAGKKWGREFGIGCLKIILISLCCFFLGNALLFGIIGTWDSGIIIGLLSVLFSPILSIFGWILYPVALMYAAFMWYVFSPSWGRKYRVLFVLAGAIMGAVGVAFVGPGEVGKFWLFRTAFFVAAGISTGVAAYMVTRLKKGNAACDGKGKMPPLILASASPRRRDLLASAGFDFRVVVADVEEIDDPAIDAATLVRVNALLKARAVAAKHPDALVLGADTTVVLDGKIYGKPADMAEARTMLQALAGRTHEVLTGVALICGGREHVFHETSRVTFRNDIDSDTYFSHVNPLDKAGAYAAQEHAEEIIERIEGDRNNVIGLPVARVCEELTTSVPSCVS